MYPIDRHFANAGIDVVRYVDDIYAFFKTHDGCVRSVIDLYRELRKLDLDLNEAKSSITTPVGLLTTDPDLDAMFDAAIAEIEIDEKVQAGYGFQGIWEEDEGEMEFEEQSIELQATTRLFDQISEYPDQIEDIERFCLPIFSAFQSDYAIDHVLAKLESTRSMSQIYFSYLSSFLHEIRVTNKICSVFKEQRLMFEWEYIWLIGCLVQLKHTDDSVVAALLQFSKTNVHDAVKALALIATVKLGDFHRQKTVVEAISTFQSTYLRGAILFSARYMHKALRKNTLDLLEHQDTYLRLIAVSVRKHSKS